MFKKILESGVIKDLRQIISFMKLTGVRLKFFILSLFFSLSLTLFNLYTVALLFPLVQGIINGNFNHVKDLKLIGTVVKHYPLIFNNSIKLFVLLIVWIYVNIIFKNILQYISSVSIGYQAKNATVNMRKLLFDKCLEFGKSFYDKNKVANIHAIVTKSSGTIEVQFKSLQSLIVDIFLIAMYLSSMIFISWKLTIICGITFPIVNSFTKRSINRIKEITKKTEEASLALNDRIFNILNCIPLVKGFAKENYERNLYQIASQKEIDESFKAKKISSLLGPIEDVGSTTSILLLAFGMAMVIYFDKGLSSANAFIFFYLAQNLINKLNSLNNFKLSIVQSGKMVDDINNLLQENNNYIIYNGEREFDNLKEKIEIKNLFFAYSTESKTVLNDLSLIIPKGKITAIVGPTGSGKSTIANLLLRFYDCPKDSIFIDGVDIREFEVKSLRKKIAFINQDSLLFNDTIRHNITYSLHEEISDDEVISISKKTMVHDFVDFLPEKYTTIIGERGSNFSGGEKQRIAITRALIKDYDLLIMDEATSALDAKTEQVIINMINTVSKDKTVIIISHRLSTIKNADNIIFIKNGKIEESGTLEEVLNLKGLFYNDWVAQKI
jgi:ATP-binding cassette, subfamily B, bacterial MsbA